MADLGKMISIVATAFVGKKDKGGKPYVLHCLHVMDKVKYLGDIAMIAAVGHDLVEDTDWTLEDLRAEGFSEEAITIIDCVTHRKDEEYEDYIKRTATNDIARAIKMADLKHNSDITRMKGLRKKDFDRLEKYHRSYEYLRF